MNILDILRKKRDGEQLSAAEIQWFIHNVVAGTLSDTQIAAWLMAACIRGLSGEETAALTLAMAQSGQRLQLPHDRPVIDKHSTGGVGDTVSLILLPVAVAAGCAVPMISGRGLGHTGGTVDKLESITGLQLAFSPEQYVELLRTNGGFFAKQTANIAPADRQLYHIRDVTATVESVGLITASILSKKMAEDLDGLVLDLKVGKGAFMPTMEAARQLADQMLAVASAAELPMEIVFSAMDQPLGRAVGNWVEVMEAIECLQQREQCPKDLGALTEFLAATMLRLAGLAPDYRSAQQRVQRVWDSGAAFETFQRIIAAQGGNLQESQRLYAHTPREPLRAWETGTITEIHARKVGQAGITLGIGRVREQDPVDYAAGFIFAKKEGEPVEKGEPIVWIYASDPARIAAAAHQLRDAIHIGEPQPKPAIVLDSRSNIDKGWNH